MLSWLTRRSVNPQVSSLASQLQERGFACVPDFWPQAKCTRAVAQLDEYLAQPDSAVQQRGEPDERIFGAEHVSPDILEFKHSSLCREVGAAFTRKNQTCWFTMANRLQKRGDAPARSGGRWHRDRNKRQFKAMLYLVDVELATGPFSILPGSHHRNARAFGAEIRAAGFDYRAGRWDTKSFNPFRDLIADRLEVLTAPAGTLLLFDSSLIHSGQPNTAGVRYAITNYYFGAWEMRSSRATEKWSPFAGPLLPT